jgi:hypothetical protein
MLRLLPRFATRFVRPQAFRPALIPYRGFGSWGDTQQGLPENTSWNSPFPKKDRPKNELWDAQDRQWFNEQSKNASWIEKMHKEYIWYNSYAMDLRYKYRQSHLFFGNWGDKKSKSFEMKIDHPTVIHFQLAKHYPNLKKFVESLDKTDKLEAGIDARIDTIDFKYLHFNTVLSGLTELLHQLEKHAGNLADYCVSLSQKANNNKLCLESDFNKRFNVDKDYTEMKLHTLYSELHSINSLLFDIDYAQKNYKECYAILEAFCKKLSIDPLLLFANYAYIDNIVTVDVKKLHEQAKENEDMAMKLHTAYRKKGKLADWEVEQAESLYWAWRGRIDAIV